MMGLFRPSRERAGPDRFLFWKMLLFTVGAAAGLAGMAAGNGTLVYVALAILGVAVLLRFVPDRDEDGADRDG